MAKTKINVQMWQTRVQRALDLQAKETPLRNDILKLYHNEFFGEPGRKIKNDEISEVDFVWRYIKTKVSTVYARDPFIFCRSDKSSSQPFAEVMEVVLNYYWRELELKEKIKSCVKAACLIPPAWVQIGFTGKLESKKTEGEQGITEETIKNENVFAREVYPNDVLWPDGYHVRRDAPYLIVREKITYLDLLNNPLYKDCKKDLYEKRNSSASKIPGLFKMSSNMPQGNNSTAQEDLELTPVTLYHIWNKRDNQRFTIASGYNDDTLFEQDWISGEFPLYDLAFNEKVPTEENAQSYPISDITPMLPQLRDLSIINSAMLRHGKRAGSVIIAQKGSLSDTEITNIQESGDIELILLESVTADKLQHFTTPNLPSDWYKLRSLIIEDLVRTSGLQQLLVQMQGINTATESNNLRAGELILRSDSVDTMEEFTVKVARGLAAHIWMYMSRDEIAQIYGEPLTEEMWPSLPDNLMEARRIIQKELNFRIEAGSMQPPRDEAVEREQWIKVTQMLKMFFPERIKDDIYLKQFLKKEQYKDIESFVITDDQEEMQAASQENELLVQDIPCVVSPSNYHMAHISIHSQMPQRTNAGDEHIMIHGQFYQKTQPQTKGQGIKPSDTMRGGVPEDVDLIGGAMNIDRGMNTGGSIPK